MAISVGQNLNQNEQQNISNFQNLLNCTKDKLLQSHSSASKADFWKTFELDVHQAAKCAAKELNLKWNIQYISGHKFPDIVAKINEEQSFGIEVKTLSTKSKSWKVMGGSIMESTRIPDVSRIQIFCAKQNPFEIKYRPFEDCVSSVAVTHSPRYMLDMNQGECQSLFDKIKKPYEDVRQMQNPFDAFKGYLIDSKKLGRNSENNDDESFWWYSPEAQEVSYEDIEEQQFAENLINSNIQFWSELSSADKKYYKAKMLIKFPHVVEGDYNNASKWLLKTKGIINPSFRDTFSAGGKEIVNGVRVRKIISNINKWKNEIVKVLESYGSPHDSFILWQSHIKEMKNFSGEEKKVLLNVVAEIGKLVET